jgi:hypothetical protein
VPDLTIPQQPKPFRYQPGGNIFRATRFMGSDYSLDSDNQTLRLKASIYDRIDMIEEDISRLHKWAGLDL